MGRADLGSVAVATGFVVVLFPSWFWKKLFLTSVGDRLPESFA